jgi:hypothetical protein
VRLEYEGIVYHEYSSPDPFPLFLCADCTKVDPFTTLVAFLDCLRRADALQRFGGVLADVLLVVRFPIRQQLFNHPTAPIFPSAELASTRTNDHVAE